MGLNAPAPALPLSAYKLDRLFILIPTVVCAYETLISPLLIFLTTDPVAGQIAISANSRIENKVFWPLVSLLSLLLAWRKLGQARQLNEPAGLLILTCYIALAGCSVFWSAEPETTIRRAVHEAMVLVSIVVPVALSERRSQVFSDLFLCFAAVALLNLFFVLTQPPTPIGHAGYYNHKNALGANIAFSYIFAVYEIMKGNLLRRSFALLIAATSLFLLVSSQSKTSLGLAILTPVIGIILVALVRSTSISPAWLVTYCLALFMAASMIVLDVLGLSTNDVSMYFFGDDTFTGRTTIWAFAIAKAEPNFLLGWGYQAFWGESLDAPSRSGPGWVALMPHGHNGYIDTLLGTGLIGLLLLLGLIVSALNASRSIAERSLRLGGLITSLMLFVILHNGLETTFLRSASTPWVIFVVLLTFVGSDFDKRRQSKAPR